MTISKLMAAVLVAAILPAACCAATPAEGRGTHTTPDTFIEGGKPAPDIPWAVQLWDESPRVPATFACTAEQISATWVITAKHCVVDKAPSSLSIYATNQYPPEGIVQPLRLDRVVTNANADVALLHLARRRALPQFPALVGSDHPYVGRRGLIYGFGKANGDSEASPQSLRVAVVSLDGTSWIGDENGVAIVVTGITGSARAGDSGGPLIDADAATLIGVLSSGSSSPGTNATAYYTSLYACRDWIRGIAGV
ncbi:trypsin-like serine protease [Leifsonia sp. ZF2019]|uniref:S1 family peptidase n=1 Tax=Leifsonia sp. ZF2019 TaxID=2781978 RepID=UPI001CBE6258|nr:trypsin-like serine protease [Leifsonia sp. ZF2019]UAJ80109.1 trypsin-like serine protease [Leifsonia sp. ZF2019]